MKGYRGTAIKTLNVYRKQSSMAGAALKDAGNKFMKL